MKQFVAIAFSLLLIVAQTFAVGAAVSRKAVAAPPSCCGEGCHCCVNQADGGPAAPVESTVPSSANNQFVLAPVARLLFDPTFAAPASALPAADLALPFAQPPLYRLNCALLL